MSAINPSYVVQRIRDDGSVSGDYFPPDYYRGTAVVRVDDTTIDMSSLWSRNVRDAFIFSSLQAASRIARAAGDGAQVRVLATDEELADFLGKKEV